MSEPILITLEIKNKAIKNVQNKVPHENIRTNTSSTICLIIQSWKEGPDNIWSGKS